MSDDPRKGSGEALVQRFELELRYDRRTAADPSQWRFALSDTGSHERVGGVGIAGLAEAVALLTSRASAPPSPNGTPVVET
jgi:hypothetical protein